MSKWKFTLRLFFISSPFYSVTLVSQFYSIWLLHALVRARIGFVKPWVLQEQSSRNMLEAIVLDSSTL